MPRRVQKGSARFFTSLAISRSCSSVSTAQGPAMTVKLPGPIRVFPPLPRRAQVKLFVSQLVAFCDGNDLIHFRRDLQVLVRQLCLVAHHTDDGNFLAPLRGVPPGPWI